MTIGDLLRRLAPLDPDEPLVIPHNRWPYLAGTWGSYRGYYDELMLEGERRDCGHNTVGGLRALLESALRAGTMTGYKGGEYPIRRYTRVWLGEYGDSDGAVVGAPMRLGDRWYLLVAPPDAGDNVAEDYAEPTP